MPSLNLGYGGEVRLSLDIFLSFSRQDQGSDEEKHSVHGAGVAWKQLGLKRFHPDVQGKKFTILLVLKRFEFVTGGGVCDWQSRVEQFLLYLFFLQSFFWI